MEENKILRRKELKKNKNKKKELRRSTLENEEV